MMMMLSCELREQRIIPAFQVLCAILSIPSGKPFRAFGKPGMMVSIY